MLLGFDFQYMDNDQLLWDAIAGWLPQLLGTVLVLRMTVWALGFLRKDAS